MTSILYGKIARELWLIQRHWKQPVHWISTAERSNQKEKGDSNACHHCCGNLSVLASCSVYAYFLCRTIFREPLPRARCCQQSGQFGAINPLLCIFLSSKMKVAFLQMLGKRSCRKRDETQTKTKRTGENPIPLHGIYWIMSMTPSLPTPVIYIYAIPNNSTIIPEKNFVY